MCTMVILRRPGHDWPVLIGANRDEMIGRAWKRPGRHWKDRPYVLGGLDEKAGGTWLGINDSGVVAGLLNRRNSLGTNGEFRSRGELPLEALDHADASIAAKAMSNINSEAYKPFNLVIADNEQAFWIYLTASAQSASVKVERVPEGISIFVATGRNDDSSPRIRLYLPQFEKSNAPKIESGDWSAWISLLTSNTSDEGVEPDESMIVSSNSGFATVSSALLALPSQQNQGVMPKFLFADVQKKEFVYDAIKLD